MSQDRDQPKINLQDSSVTVNRIRDLINGITTFPYKFPIFVQKQKFPVYPSLEIIKTKSISATTEVSREQLNQEFEFTFRIKYTRREDLEDADRIIIEETILDTINQANIVPDGKIFFESKEWSHNILDDQVYGSESRLSFRIQEVRSTTGDGIITAYMSISLNGSDDIQILNYNSTDGPTITPHLDSMGNTHYDPLDLKKGEYFVTYEDTIIVKNLIENLADARNLISITIKRQSLPDQMCNGYVGETTRTGQYSDTDKATTRLYLEP